MNRRPKIDKSALAFGETVRTREPDYIAWLHTQPCVVSGQRGDVVVHHPRAIIPEPRAKGRKCSDRFAVSLLARYHINGGADSVHGRLGEARWWPAHGVDLMAVIARCGRVGTPDRKAAPMTTDAHAKPRPPLHRRHNGHRGHRRLPDRHAPIRRRNCRPRSILAVGAAALAARCGSGG